MSIVFLIIIVAILVIVTKGKGIKVPNFGINGNSLLIGYFAVLVILSLLFYFIPYELTPLAEEDRLRELEDIDAQIYHAANNGTLDKVDALYVKDRWSEPLSGNSIKIILPEEGPASALIYAERKSEKDGKIDITHYETRSVFQDIDFESHQLQVKDNSVEVINPKPIHIKVAGLNKEFTITQFTGEDGYYSNIPFTGIVGTEVFYLRIPKDVEVEGDIWFVKE